MIPELILQEKLREIEDLKEKVNVLRTKVSRLEARMDVALFTLLAIFVIYLFS